MASDRLALDPLAASGDPMERLIARVADLEYRLAATTSASQQGQYANPGGVWNANGGTTTYATMQFNVPNDQTILSFFAESSVAIPAGNGASAPQVAITVSVGAQDIQASLWMGSSASSAATNHKLVTYPVTQFSTFFAAPSGALAGCMLMEPVAKGPLTVSFKVYASPGYSINFTNPRAYARLEA